MPPYYSKQALLISNFSDLPTVCGVPVLPLRASSTARSGPCPIHPDSDFTDIISEALEFFRFNALVLKSRFDLKSGPDKILMLITLWIHQCLRELGYAANELKSLEEVVEFLLALPRADFLTKIQFLFSKPFSKKDQVLFREYIEELQTETCHRLAQVVWNDSCLNKYWTQYGQINIISI